MTVNRFFSELHFGAFADLTDEQLRLFGRALLSIVAADRLSATELSTFEEIATHLGTPAAIIQELAATDPATIDLVATLEGLHDDFGSRVLLYNAIVIASTDGYTDKERVRAANAAELLGMSPDCLRSIEQLVVAEAAQRRLKAAILKARC